MQVGDLLDSKSYGLGLRKNSAWHEKISNGIIFLQETGRIHQFYEKWWKQIDAVNCESPKTSDDDNKAMNFSSVAGIFLVLAIGIGLSCIVGCIEYIWKVKRNPKNKASERIPN